MLPSKDLPKVLKSALTALYNLVSSYHGPYHLSETNNNSQLRIRCPCPDASAQLIDGASDGETEGDELGLLVGSVDGNADGFDDGNGLGAAEGE
eukprot:scaffold7304_cov135-Skeletonema_menzelii.AAC.5